MKKVLCIKEGAWVPNFGPSYGFGPKYGELCEVIGEYLNEDYIIKEYERDRDGILQSFLKKWFIPLSNIDERDFIREGQEGRLETAIK